MLGKLAVVLVLCQIVAFTYGGVLRQTSDEETCSEMYLNCTEHEDCCGVLRCLDFGNGMQCLYGTDNPQIKQVANDAVQPPLDLIKNLGCGLFAQTCEVLLDCCAPYVCSANGTCLEPDQDPFGLGFPGFPGK